MTAREQADDAASTIAYTERWLERIEAARASLDPDPSEPRCSMPHHVQLALSHLRTAAEMQWQAQRQAIADLHAAQQEETAAAFQPEHLRSA